MTSFLPNLLDLILNPLRRVTEPDRIQRSRLLSAILVALLLSGVLIVTLVLRHDPEDINEPAIQGAFVLGGTLLIMYVINRLGYTSLAAAGVILPFVAIFIYVAFFSGEDPLFLAFLMVPIVLTAIFYSLQWTAAVSVAILALVLVFLSTQDQVSPASPFWNLRNIWFFLLMASVLILTFMWHLGNLEKIRRNELKRANEQLEQEIAALEQLMYTVSHDLKSPIVTIRGFVGLLDKDIRQGDSEHIGRDFKRIRDAADKMQNLITDLLEFSKTGRIINVPEEVNLTALVQEALVSLGESLTTSNTRVNIVNDLPVVYGDRARLLQLFEHLIDNATKYMGARPDALIEIGQRDHGKVPVIYVKDNGIGIEPQFQQKIFGLFDKLDTASEGTGIGLPLIKRIIELHGGRIWVESDGLNKGSTFCFTIPDSRSRKTK